MSHLDSWLSTRLGAWVDGVRLRARWVVWLCLLATLGLGTYAALNLSINSDNLALLSEDIPARRNHAAFTKIFPNLESALFVVIDAETPELVRTAAERIETRLHDLPDLFEEVYAPDGGDFFLRHGLLYRSVEDLEAFADRIAAMQPIIATLERDASIGSLSKLVRRGLEAVREGDGEGAEDWPLVLDRVSQATIDVHTEFPIAVSWDELLLRGSSLETSTRRVIVVHAALDFDSPFSAARAVNRIRDEARAMDFTPERGVTVRVTGNPALNYEEMVGIAWDVGAGGLFCFVLVAGILQLALGSWKLVVAAISTLLVGLVWAAAVAAATVGHLTVVSLAFAILFIGLGVDFAIHLGMRYAHQIRAGNDHAEAMRSSAEDVGSSLVLCTVTTVIGFFVFVPTDYIGVAELGLIAGISMVAITFLTFTFFPALLSTGLALNGDLPTERTLPFEEKLGRGVSRHAALVRWVALGLFFAGAATIPSARFDPNVVDMRDPGTESVQAFNDLLAQTGMASPWYVDAVAPDLDQAEALAKQLDALEVVERAVSLADYVPEDQELKREILADLSFMLGPPQGQESDDNPPPVEEQVEALRALRDFLAQAQGATSPGQLDDSMHRLREHLDEFFARVESEGDLPGALKRLEEILLSNLSQQLGRLRMALSPGEVSLDTLPEELRSRMLAPDRRARVQIFPSHNLRSEGAMRDFTEAVANVAPSANGIAFNLLAFEETTKRSFLQALASAVALITLLLLWLWRRVGETLLVLAPLVLGAVLSVAAMALLGISFNFVNVIVIPLMFGIGVDSGIHLVHRANELEPGGELLGTTTARAVFYSALTTTVSFGSLGFSSHVGMSGLGTLLAIGMLLTIFCNLVVLPSLIEWRRGRA